MDRADDLRRNDQYKESIRYYLDALNLAREDWENGVKDELWQKKAIFMACTGMGIAYAKWGKLAEAIDNFQDAIVHAPTEEALQVAKSNLGKYQKALKDKTGIEFSSYLIN